jgi:hypothetical protein
MYLFIETFNPKLDGGWGGEYTHTKLKTPENLK